MLIYAYICLYMLIYIMCKYVYKIIVFKVGREKRDFFSLKKKDMIHKYMYYTRVSDVGIHIIW